MIQTRTEKALWAAYVAGVLVALACYAKLALSAPLSTPAAYCTSYPYLCRTGTMSLLMAKGIGDNNLYVLEVDPATGQIPVAGSFSASFASVGATGAAVPASADYAGMNVGGNLVGMTGTANGLKVDGSAVTQPVSGTFWQATQPVSGTVTANAGTGTFAVSAASLPLPTGAATSAKQPALGTAGTPSTDVLTVQGAASMTALKVDGSATTQPISAASLPLPTGAATSALQTTGNTSLASIDGKTPALGQAAAAGSVPVVISTRQESVATPLAVQLSNGTSAIDYNSGPAGTTTPRVVLANRHESAATPVSVRISDGSAFNTPMGKGRTYADSVRYDYTGVNVGTVSWVQLVASTAANINAITIFDSSGKTLELGTGGAGSETRVMLIPPGGVDGPVQLYIPAGTRVAVRAVSATATAGELDITGYN